MREHFMDRTIKRLFMLRSEGVENLFCLFLVLLYLAIAGRAPLYNWKKTMNVTLLRLQVLGAKQLSSFPGCQR